VIDLRNSSENEFTDISSEAVRTYVFDTELIQILAPCWLSVSASGGHRILDEEGFCWYIPPKWLAIQWKVRDDAPHFVK
jgi:hypothetical protein